MIKNVINYEYGKMRLFKLDFTTMLDIYQKKEANIEDLKKIKKKWKVYITKDVGSKSIKLPDYLTRTNDMTKSEIIIGKYKGYAYENDTLFVALYDLQDPSVQLELSTLGLSFGDMFYYNVNTNIRCGFRYSYITYVIDKAVSDKLNKDIYFINSDEINFYDVGTTDLSFDECLYLKKILVEKNNYGGYSLIKNNKQNIDFYNSLISSLNVRNNIESIIFLLHVTSSRLPDNHLMNIAISYIDYIVMKKCGENMQLHPGSVRYLYSMDIGAIDKLVSLGFIKPGNRQLFINNIEKKKQ
mgnify:CR=1 FL=1